MNYRLRFGLIILSVILITCSGAEQEKEYQAPKWAKGITWYQIFPERFHNGDLSNDPDRQRARGPEGWEITPWTSDWYARADWEQDDTDDFYGTVFERRYGGDLLGVITKLDYLKELGVEAIYFNPVFDAQSLHKYDGSYFHHIDRNFGPDPAGDVLQFSQEDPSDPATWGWTSADSLFLTLIEEAHEREIRVVIDGVFNHSGTEFWAFQDIRQKQQESEFTDWYIVNSYDDPATPDTNEFDYEGWWGFKGLPVFSEVDGNLYDPVKEYIFAITRRWMDPNGDGDPSDGIDGWRLDVAEEVGIPFWKEWHAEVHRINPEAITVAEIWTEKAREYINAELFTSVMNYRFAYAAKDFLIDDRISTGEFIRRLQQVQEEYPDASLDVLQNLMDSHDTPRLASMIVNPGLEYDRDSGLRDNADYQVRKPNEQERRIQRMVALFQFTWQGAPMIYYGTEAGMWGADDPDDRKPMVWPEFSYDDEEEHPLGQTRQKDENNFNDQLYSYYQSLMALRDSSEALKNGNARFVYEDEQQKTVAFVRETGGEEAILVVLNRSEETVEFTIPAEDLEGDHASIRLLMNSNIDIMSTALGSVQEGAVSISIPGIAGAVFRLEGEN